MNCPFESGLVTSFNDLISSPPPAGRQKEQVIQDFMEQHTEFIPTPNLLNHHLHFQTIISKFPLTTDLVTDYLYITKSSDVWRVTLVELETPDKPIFTQDMKRTNTTAEFNAALNQVRSWKDFLHENKAEVVRKLEPLLRPLAMQRNPIEFHYQLIIGRSQDKNLSETRKKRFRGLMVETGIDILTYDGVLSWYENSPRYKKNVLRLSGAQYAFKHMHFEPTQILSYVGPDRLELSLEQANQLQSMGYEIDKWRTGDLLTYNSKWAESTFLKHLKKGTLVVPSGK